MAAPKGNKYAVGNHGGRPREYDLKVEARIFREWADEEDSLVLRLFAAIRGYADQSKLHEYAHMEDEFRQAFNYARVTIGARRESLLIQGKGHAAPFMRYASLYDKELKAHEKEIKEQDAANAQTVVAGDITQFMQHVRSQNGSKGALPEANNGPN